MVRSKRSPVKKRNSVQVLHMGRKMCRIRTSLLRTIRKLQLSTKHCIPKSPFSKLIREILQHHYGDRVDLRIQRRAIDALQEAAELYLVGLFEDASICAFHAKRITVRPDDMQLVLTLRGPTDVFNH